MVGEGVLKCLKGHARTHANAVFDNVHAAKPLGAEHHVAKRRGAAGERRLGANRQNPASGQGGWHQTRRQLFDSARAHDPDGPAIRIVRGVFQVARNQVRIGFDGNGARMRRTRHDAIHAPILGCLWCVRCLGCLGVGAYGPRAFGTNP